MAKYKINKDTKTNVHVGQKCCKWCNKETSSNIKTFEGTSWENCQNVNSACDCWLLYTVNELSLNLHA